MAQWLDPLRLLLRRARRQLISSVREQGTGHASGGGIKGLMPPPSFCDVSSEWTARILR